MKTFNHIALIALSALVCACSRGNSDPPPDLTYHLTVNWGGRSCEPMDTNAGIVFSNIEIDDIPSLLPDARYLDATKNPTVEKWVQAFVQDSILSSVSPDTASPVHVFGVVINARTNRGYLVDRTFLIHDPVNPNEVSVVSPPPGSANFKFVY